MAAIALLWPLRALASLDGIPLDAPTEAIAIGLLFPALCALHPRFVTTRTARALALSLLALKLAASLTLVQQGWCGQFLSSEPLNANANLTQLSWDARADWRHPVPQCSAVVARAYPDLLSFPAWFLNLTGTPDRPPNGLNAFVIDGYLWAPARGSLLLGLGGGQTITVSVDDAQIADGGTPIELTPGVHRVRVATALTGDRWRFAPTWNGADVFSTMLTTTAAPRAWDRWSWRVVPAINDLLVMALLGTWAIAAVLSLQFSRPAALWLGVMIPAMAIAGARSLHSAGRAGVAVLIAAAFVPVADRFRTARGALALIGLPWLALFAGHAVANAGRFTLFTTGDDFSFFQRFAYRIYMQGYWLEGGQQTFWYQPLYRWIIGALHIVFGDSSIGDWFLDAASLLIAAMFVFVVCRRVTSFAWSAGAGALTLATVAVGPTWWLVGRDLSEIVACGFAYAAALVIVGRGSRSASLDPPNESAAWWRVGLASVLAVMCFYTRLNHVMWAAALVVFLLPPDLPAARIWQPREWLTQAAVTRALLVLGVLGAGVLLFALRTWHYSGVFSVMYGTQRELLATIRPGDSVLTSIGHMVESVLVQITVQDPPRFDPRALPAIAGVLVSLLAILHVRGFRDVPAAPVLFCLAGLAGAFVARGTAYVGRFSIHLIPVSVAVATCAAAPMVDRWRQRRA